MIRKLFFLTVSLIMFCGFPAAQENVPVQKIEVEPKSWDFGKISQGDTVNCVFHIRNRGSSDLQLLKVRSTCGCTLVKVSTGTMKPGDEREVEVSFNSKGYYNDVNKYMYVDSDDPVSPNITLTLTGKIIPPFAEIYISPRIGADELADSKGNKILTQQLVIKNGGMNAMKIKKIRSSSSDYKIILSSDEIKKGNAVSLPVKMKPDRKPSKKTEYIYLNIAIPIIPDTTF